MRLCQRCKEIQQTCCQGTNITLTQGDVRRIAQASGRSDFIVMEHYPDLSFQEPYRFDPHWQTYTVHPGNVIRRLKMGDHGDCLFLSKNGCVLPQDARPFICRLYPYNYNEFGMIGLTLNEDFMCPIHTLQEGETLSDMLALSWEEADRWRMMFYEELRAEYQERR